MSLTPEQAAQALREIDVMSGRSGRLRRYAHSAPILTLWGWIWLIGFGASEACPGTAVLIWILLNTAGIAGSLYLGRRGSAHQTASASRRWLGTVLALLAFYLSALSLFPNVSTQQSTALVSLIIAVVYVIVGFWFGARFAVAGTLLAILTLAGYFLLPAHFGLWMAVLGGGSLMLAGAWLRRV